MIYLYLIPVFFFIVGGLLWYYNEEYTFVEWMMTGVVGILSVVIISVAVFTSSISDVQIYSGYLMKATYHPKWVEEYVYTDCTTISEGNQSCTIKTDYIIHWEFWSTDSNIDTTYRISEQFYNELKSKFGKYDVQKSYKPGFYSGDPNIYVTTNINNIIYPVNDNRVWLNKLKLAKSNFNYSEKKVKGLYKYPLSSNWRISKRLLGTAAIDFSIGEWDKLNAVLGVSKKVNLIAIGFGNKPKTIAMDQEAFWLGGKRNDLVICYGYENGKRWVYTFGWTENLMTKRQLDNLFIDKKPSNKILPDIKEIVNKYYVLKDWHKFDYIEIELPLWVYVLEFIICLIVQVTVMFCFLNNNERK